MLDALKVLFILTGTSTYLVTKYVKVGIESPEHHKPKGTDTHHQHQSTNTHVIDPSEPSVPSLPTLLHNDDHMNGMNVTNRLSIAKYNDSLNDDNNRTFNGSQPNQWLYRNPGLHSVNNRHPNDFQHNW
ncbi:unnamed protein product [Oppiella nova]|uniref:Uncharacterized protein n=1 Tax=Oppiella nova TaxID=334625 RepID=A0A7R9QR79_9ACAR|nr:unnamed protein product [Oppiella nova]CAG2171998.1 unnamed protein product [Oppiella nova]